MAIEITGRESVQFKIGQDQVEVYYRKPDSQEMIKYLARSLSARSGESLEYLLEAGLELAGDCILGIREGDVVLVDDCGRRVLVTDPAKTGFVQNWKGLLKQKLPGLMLMLGNHLVQFTRLDAEAREKN